LREIPYGRTITAMLHLATNGTRTKVNVLKKVKVAGQWKLCPVIAEAGGKLKDRVQVNGRCRSA